MKFSFSPKIMIFKLTIRFHGMKILRAGGLPVVPITTPDLYRCLQVYRSKKWHLQKSLKIEINLSNPFFFPHIVRKVRYLYRHHEF